VSGTLALAWAVNSALAVPAVVARPPTHPNAGSRRPGYEEARTISDPSQRCNAGEKF